MSYDEAFYYIVLGVAVAVVVAAAIFLVRANRQAKAGGPDGDGG